MSLEVWFSVQCGCDHEQICTELFPKEDIDNVLADFDYNSTLANVEHAIVQALEKVGWLSLDADGWLCPHHAQEYMRNLTACQHCEGTEVVDKSAPGVTDVWCTECGWWWTEVDDGQPGGHSVHGRFVDDNPFEDRA